MDTDFIGVGIVAFLLWILVGMIFVLFNRKHILYALIMYFGGSALAFGLIAGGGMMVTFLPCISMLAIIVFLGYFIWHWTSYRIGRWLEKS